MNLSQSIRNGISAFHGFNPPVEMKDGLDQLTKDIDSGNVENMIEEYDNVVGDYLFIHASKN